MYIATPSSNSIIECCSVFDNILCKIALSSDLMVLRPINMLQWHFLWSIGTPPYGPLRVGVFSISSLVSGCCDHISGLRHF